MTSASDASPSLPPSLSSAPNSRPPADTPTASTPPPAISDGRKEADRDAALKAIQDRLGELDAALDKRTVTLQEAHAEIEQLRTLVGRHKTEQRDLAQQIANIAASTGAAAPLLASASPLIVRAESVKALVGCADIDGAPDTATISQNAEAGERLALAYPMTRVGDAVWMRRLVACPHTAALSWVWVKLFEEVRGSDVVYVSNFHI